MASTLITDQITKIGSVWGQDADNVVYNYLSGVAGTNTITATGPVGLAAYAAGLKFRFIPAATNTGATTINITGSSLLGARNIFMNGTALTGGELVIGQQAEIVDDGTRFQIINPLGNRFLSSFTKRKTADETVNASTTLQDDDHLLFAIGASEEWVADIVLGCGGTGNFSVAGMKIAITVPAGATLNVEADVNGSTKSDTASNTTTSSGTAIDFTTAFFSGSATATIRVSVWVLNGATPGSVTLQWAESTASGTRVVRKGSHLFAVRVA